MIFAILAISCLTLVDSATAIAIDSNQDSNNETTDSLDEDYVEPVLTFFAFQDKDIDNENENELVKRNIAINNEGSQSDDKTDEENSTENIGTANNNESTKIIVFNTVKAAEKVNNTSSTNENRENTDNNAIKPITKNYGMEMQYTGILVSVIFLIISLSSFILYLKS